MGTRFSFRFSFFISRASIIHFHLVSCVMFFLLSFHHLTDPQVEEEFWILHLESRYGN
jgi:hypothetical protein